MFINRHEQSAVGVYWVSDGVDQCLVGFLHCHQVKNLNKLEAALFTATKSRISTNWKQLFVKSQRCTLTTLKALQSTTSTRRTLFVQLWPLCQVKNPTKLGSKENITKSSQNSYEPGNTYKHEIKITKAKEIHQKCNRRVQT